MKANEIKKLITKLVQLSTMGKRYSLCIWGPHGIGKTALVKSLPYPVTDIPLAQIEEMGDIHGLPIKENVEGKLVTRMAPPVWVPTQEGPGILLLDDFNRADIRILRGTMQLIQDNKTISWGLPPKYIIVLTGNPDEGDYQVTSVDAAMLTRTINVNLDPDIRDWLAWAAGVGVDSRIQGFLAKYQEMLAPSGAVKTCPRTWEMVSDLIKGETDPIYIKGVASNLLDTEASALLVQFITEDLEWLIEPQDLLKSAEKPKIIEKFLKRLDMLNVAFDRLLAYCTTANLLEEQKKGAIELFELENLPREVKVFYVKQFIERGATWLTSNKLVKQVAEVV